MEEGVKEEKESEVREDINIVIRGNALEVLREYPDEFFDCVVTSPPYYSLRWYPGAECVWGGDKRCEHRWVEVKVKQDNLRYRVGRSTEVGNFINREIYPSEYWALWRVCDKCGAMYGQLGLEPSFDLYIEHLLEVIDEIKRVLKKSGTFWLNLGDCYPSTGNKGGSIYELSDEEYESEVKGIQIKYGKPMRGRYPHKCLGLIPFRVAIEMIDRGWILRNCIVWCLAEDTKMFVLRDGVYLHIPIQEVKVGDYVLTFDMRNNLRMVRVKNVYDNGIAPVLRIITKSGREVVCTEEHEFPVKASYVYGSEFLQLSFKKAKELTGKDYLWVNWHLPLVGSKAFSMEDYAKGFVVGFFIAEGNYIKKRLKSGELVYRGIQFSCGVKDLEKGYIDYLKAYDVKIYRYGRNVIVRSHDKRLLSLIKSYVDGERAKDKHFKQSVWNESIEFMKGVVDGFLAGDGCFDKKHNRWMVGITFNQDLLDDLVLACRLIGYEFRYEGVKRTNLGTKAVEFVIRPSIKRCRYKEYLYVDQIDKIEMVGVRRVYDIEVEPIYTSYCGKGKTDKPTIEKRKAKWNNLYFLANGIWTHNSKPNAIPQSVKDRFKNVWEPIFLFVKQAKYFFNLEAVKVPMKASTLKRALRDNRTEKDVYAGLSLENWRRWVEKVRKKVGMEREAVSGMRLPPEPGEWEVRDLLANPGDVWSISTKPFKGKHFAVFPPEIPMMCILAGCPEGGVVLDPFAGSGTTLVVAKKLGRKYVGIEIVEEYVKICEERLREVNELLPFEGG